MCPNNQLDLVEMKLKDFHDIVARGGARQVWQVASPNVMGHLAFIQFWVSSDNVPFLVHIVPITGSCKLFTPLKKDDNPMENAKNGQ